MRLMGSFVKLRKQADSLLRGFVEESDAWRDLASSSPDIFRNIKKYCLADGKRLRPVLFMASYQAYKGEPMPASLGIVPVALELLHGFVLIHDDLVDRAEQRRNKPSLQRQLNSLFGRRLGHSTGEDIALVSGDLLYALAMRIFLQAPVGPELQLAGMARLTDTALLTGRGELLEMLATAKNLDSLDEESLFEIYDFKTSHYSFCCPMILGALFSERSGRTEEALLTRIGLAAGRAFQIADDVDDILSSANKSSSDLVERRRTLLLLWTRERVKLREKRMIDKCLAMDEPLNSEMSSLMKDLICTSGALDYARARSLACKKEALSLLPKLHVSRQGREKLEDIIDCVLSID